MSSDINLRTWVTCEKKALVTPGWGTGSAAAVFGAQVLARLVGGTPELPDEVRFDSLSARRTTLVKQIDLAVAEAERCLEEVSTGRIACGGDPSKAPLSECGLVLMTDLCGRVAVSVAVDYSNMDYLSLGGLLCGPGAGVLQYGAVLKVFRRPAASRSARAELGDFRPAPELRTEYGAWMTRVNSIRFGGLTPVANPGVHCKRCPAECAVRILQ